MNVTRKEQRIIQRALNAWQASGELTPSDSQRLAHTLRVYAAEMRRKRLLRAEEHANKLPVRMVLPMGCLIMPAFIIAITVPAVIRVIQAFGL